MNNETEKEGITFGEFMKHVDEVAVPELEGFPIIHVEVFESLIQPQKLEYATLSVNNQVRRYMFDNNLKKNDIVEYHAEVVKESAPHSIGDMRAIRVILSHWINSQK